MAILIISTLLLLSAAFFVAWRWWGATPALYWFLSYLCWSICDLLLYPTFQVTALGPAILPQSIFQLSIFFQMHGLQVRSGRGGFALRTRIFICVVTIVLTAALLSLPHMKWAILSSRLLLRLALTAFALIAMRDRLSQRIDQILFGVVVVTTCSIGIAAAAMIHESYMATGKTISEQTVFLVQSVGNVVGIAFALTALSALVLDVAQRYRSQALQDPLTGLPNRRHFAAYESTAWKDAASLQQPLSMLLIDVDLFKAYNDIYGHASGDRCLIKVANTIRSATQQRGSLCVRFGGEEFVVLLPNTKQTDAVFIAEDVCSQVRGLGLVHRSSPFGHVTVSVGVATMTPSAVDKDTLFETADSAMYMAKKRGRNGVVVASA